MILFTVAIFASASLLFVVQPMVGKLLLPKLGGAPAVWNTCMLFFQATLLAGYLSAFLMTRFVNLKWQVVLYVSGLVLALSQLPLSVAPESTDALLRGADPNFWLLGVLITRVAPVFFMLSITSPLMQNWFARTGHPRGHDPYFLYSASNIGSILSLVLFPFVLEVSWGVNELSVGWMWGFGGFIGLAVLCGFVSCIGAARQRRTAELFQATETTDSKVNSQPVTWSRRGYWVVLSLIPSSLMLGVTTYVSTDVSSVPLIWIIPLTIYLLTFVLAFSRRQWISSYWLGRIAALLIVTIAVTVVTGGNDPPCVIIPLHLLMFGIVALFCHQRLAADRPASSNLTEFYLWMSIGGVLGGLCNALLAPVLFSTIFEYPLVMLIATFFRETRSEDNVKLSSKMSVARFGVFVFVLVLGLMHLVDHYVPVRWIVTLSTALNLPTGQIETLLCFGPPACLLFSQLEKRAVFSVGLAAMLLVSVWNRSTDAHILEQNRNFYGTLATKKNRLGDNEVLRMVHGNTVHGCQWVDEARRGVPLMYYGEHSGVSHLIHARQTASDKPLRVGAVGLGAGSLAAWLNSGDTIVYYEINALVVDHAERYFSYLSDARKRGVHVEIRTGDARLILESELRQADRPRYDLLLVDAFSSDSIPVHLITEEAFDIYRSMVDSNGVVSFHISNRFLNLEPVLSALSRESQWVGYRYDFDASKDGSALDEKTGESSSSWVVMASAAMDLGSLTHDPSLRPLKDAPDQRVWVDDYSNMLSVFEWRF